MKAHYFREGDGEKFLVPEEHIQGFDGLIKKIESANQGSDKWYDLTDEFNDKYYQYKCEGELYDTKLFIE